MRGHRRQRVEAGQRAHQAPAITLKALRKIIDATDATTVIGTLLGFAVMAR